MPHLALYRKYRSKDFNELAGQGHIIQSLENAIKDSRISHAYLFSGPKGVGKTSAARILARRINKLSAKEAENHLDIIEIDAASNRRIDEIRDLREKIYIAPSSAKYKVYIIDEVHMLTTEAFNALLKTLEEPPEHAVFILATTEIYKLPETIVSRTQHFRFQPISLSAASNHILEVAKLEGLVIDPEVAELIASAGRGSLRDSLSILDQLASMNLKSISAEAVRELLGWGDIESVESLAISIAGGKLADALKILKNLSAQGVAFTQLLEQLLRIYTDTVRAQLSIDEGARQNVIELSNTTSTSRISHIISELSNISPNSPYLQEQLEATIISLSLQSSHSSQALTENNSQKTETKPELKHRKSSKKESKSISKSAVSTATTTKSPDDAWVRILSEIKKHNNSLYALLRSADPSFNDTKLLVTFRFQFHKRRLDETANLALLKQAAAKILGDTYSIEVAVKQPRSKPADSDNEPEQDKEAVNSVLQILGGEIVNG